MPKPPSKATARQAGVALRKLADPEQARFFLRFFKAGPGQYAEGDRFLGVRVPAVRALAKELRGLGLAESVRLLESPYNEERLLGLLLMVDAYRRGGEREREAVYKAYLKSRARVNNWNLVDASAPGIVGEHLLDREGGGGRGRAVLGRLAASKNLWDRRIAVVSTLALIRAGDPRETLALCERLLGDREDLMHKACGWMLREVGKRDAGALKGFLTRWHARMPRTTLRYAIERLPPAERKAFMARGTAGQAS